MQVTTFKTIEVEVTVDVLFDDCLNEMMDRANGEPREKLAAIDFATRTLAKVGPEVLKAENRAPLVTPS